MYATLNGFYSYRFADMSRGETLTLVMDICASDEDTAHEKAQEVAKLYDYDEEAEVVSMLYVEMSQHPTQPNRWFVIALIREMSERQSVEEETPVEISL